LCHDLFGDARFHAFLLAADRDLAAKAKAAGCDCGGVLHHADYQRKSRGGTAGLSEQDERRFSFCCAEDGCRRRMTPGSLRFLGRRVYLAAVVVVVSVMRHGATPDRMRRIREVVGVDRRTVERWRLWWRTSFVDSPFWRAAAAMFARPVSAAGLPATLWARFRGDDERRLVALLRFLTPITGGGGLAGGHGR
jgi:hypothetical protein